MSIQSNQSNWTTTKPLAQEKPMSYQATKRWCVLTLLIWGTTVMSAGYYGLFTQISLYSIPPLIATGIFIPVLVYYLNPQFRAYIGSIDFKYLTLFHLWRIPAAIVFFHYGNQHLLPEGFVFNAAYGDLLVGLLAPIILLLGNRGNRKYLAFHVFSLLDFVVAVGTGLTFTILQVPLMETIATYPIIFIPLFGVPVTGALSIMTLDRLIRERMIQTKLI